tara:strand:- start:261 stop:488 length:228 start_codon:yes stop_codon:yes gene_type:complete
MIPFFLENYPNYKKLFRQSLLSVSQQEHHGEEIREEGTHSCKQDQATLEDLCAPQDTTFQEQSREAQNDLASQPD